MPSADDDLTHHPGFRVSVDAAHNAIAHTASWRTVCLSDVASKRFRNRAAVRVSVSRPRSAGAISPDSERRKYHRGSLNHFLFPNVTDGPFACAWVGQAFRRTASRRAVWRSLSRGFSHFVTSMTVPVASCGSDHRVGLAPIGKAPPYHGPHPSRTFITPR